MDDTCCSLGPSEDLASHNLVQSCVDGLATWGLLLIFLVSSSLKKWRSQTVASLTCFKSVVFTMSSRSCILNLGLGRLNEYLTFSV